MKSSLIDTDILAGFLRGNEAVIKKVEEHVREYGFINMSILTYYEILNGLLCADAKKGVKKFTEFAALNKVLPLTLRATTLAAELYADLSKKDKTLRHADMLTAGIALSSNMQLVTADTARFKNIRGLETDNWMK